MHKTALPLNVFRLRLFVLPVRVTRRWIRVWSNGRMIVEGGNLSTRIKNLSQCNFGHQTSCTVIEFRTPRWQAGERPFSDGTAMKPEFDLQITRPVSTSEKNTLLSYGKDRVVMNVEVSTGSPCYSKNHAKHTVMRNETSCVPAQQPPCLTGLITSTMHHL